MKSIKNSASSPAIHRSIIDASTNPKHKKHYIQQLQNQVNKSRIAVQNLNNNRKIQNNLYKNIEELQKELHQCILQINHESNKNKTLDELIIVLKGQMNTVQAAQRNQEEYETNNFEKKIKKVEYDIKQILQKYNEEIAKIKNLKEEANASRDERVVYSNLFNKIEKEIKHYQKIYKQTLIKNEVFIDKKLQNHDRKSTNTQPIQLKDETSYNHLINRQQSKRSHVSQTKQRPDIFKSKQAKIVSSNKKSIKNSDMQPFLTSVKQQKVHNLQKNYEPIGFKANKTPKINYQRLIDEKQGQIQQIILSSSCQTLDEVLYRYRDIYNQNNNTIIDIQSLNQSIELFQTQIQKLKLQKRTSEIYQNGQLSQIMNTNKHSRGNKGPQYDQTSTQQKNKQIILSLCKQLHISFQNDEIIINNDLLKDIDERVEQLGCIKFQQRKRKESIMINFDQLNSSTKDTVVCDLLDKIQRFNQCQKIFDRNMLTTQYQKELNKIRKKGKKNN